MSDLFKFAADLAREQAANTRYETAQRRMLESFAAMRTKTNKERSLDEINAEELASFNAAEARAINSLHGGF